MTGRPTSNRNELLCVALGGALTMGTCMGIGRFIYTPILPAMMAELGWSAGTAGLVASANYVGYLIGAVLLSLPGIPGTRRAWLLAGLAGSVALTAATGFLSGVPALFIVRLLAGIASAIGFVYSSALVLERINAGGRPGLSAVHFAGVGSAILLSSLAVTAVERAGASSSVMWFAGAVLGAAAMVAVILLIRPEPQAVIAAASPREMAAADAPQNRQGDLARMVAAYGLLGLGYIIGATFIVAMVRTDPATRFLDHWVWPAAGAAAIPSVALWNGLARRINPYRAYALASLFQASGILAALAWVNAGTALYAAVTLGGTFIALTAIGIVGARNLSAADPRRIIAGMTVAFGIGQIVGPLLAGFAVDRTGSFTLPSLIAATALAVGAALTVTIRDPRAGRSA